MKILTGLTAAALLCAGSLAVAQSTGGNTGSQNAAGTHGTGTATDRTASGTPGSADHSGHTMSGDRKDSKLDNAEFAKKAAAAGLAEVEMGKLGAQKATSADVKSYAKRMVDDHTAANKELMAAAKTKGLELPTSPDLMHKGMMEKFERQKADTDFDHDYMQQMVRDHEMVVKLFEQASSDPGVDQELRSLAKKTLPKLQAHLKEARQLESQLAGKMAQD